MNKVSFAVERFLDHCRVGRSLSANTLRAYAIDLAAFCKFVGAETLVDQITRDHLRNFARWLMDASRLKEATVKRRIAALKVMFRWLEREDKLSVSPFHRLDLVVRLPRRLPRGISAEELRALLKSIGEGRNFAALFLHLVVTLLFTTGLRIGELAGVQLGDIDRTDAFIQVRGKGNRERRVYLLGQDVGRLLDLYLDLRNGIAQETDFLLVTSRGTPASTQYIRRRLRSAAEAADLPRRLTPHGLRHTAATHLVEAGVDIRFVQKLLGHASIATTQIYTQVSDQSLRETLRHADTLGRLWRKG